MTLTTDAAPSDQSEGTFDHNTVFHASFGFDVVKAKEDGDKGQVEAVVSAFNVDYRMGFFAWHRITPEAFTESLAKQANIPIFFQHNWDWSEQPPIGTGLASAVSDPIAGLKVDASFFLDTEAGRSTFKAIKARALREWSIGYRIQDYSIEEAENGRKIVVITRAELWEASSVLRGANPNTDTLKVANWREDGKVEQLLEALADAATVMEQFGKEMAEVKERLTVVEQVHGLVEAALGSGEPVQSAAGGGSDGEDGTAAARPSPTPGSPKDDDDAEGLTDDKGTLVALAEVMGPDRIDRAMDRAIARVAYQMDKFLDMAGGAGLDNPEADENSRDDIAAMTRVVKCLNKTKFMHDAVERTVTARVLAEVAGKP